MRLDSFAYARVLKERRCRSLSSSLRCVWSRAAPRAVREKRHTQDWLEVPVALVDWLNVYLYRCNAPCVAASLLLHAAAAGRLAPSLRPLSPFASLRGPSPPAFAFRLSGGRRRRTDWAQALSRVASSTSTSVLSSPRGFSSQSAHSPAFSMSLAASDAEAELAEAASDAEPARELGTSAGAAPPSAAPVTGGGEAAEGASPPPQALRSGGASAAFACPRAREEVFECGISSPDLGAHSRSRSRSPSSYSSSGGSLTASAGRAPLARPPVGLCVPRVRVCTHTWNIPSIRFSLCASFLASCSIDRTIRLTRAQPAPRNGDTGRRREARSCRREGEVGEVLAVREIRGWAWAVSWLDVRNLGSFDWDSVADLSLPPRGSAQLPPSSPGGVFAAAAPPRRRTPGATEAASWAEERQREEDQAQFQQDAIRALLEGCEQRIRHEFTDVVRSSSFNPVTGARVRPRAKAIAETLSLAAGRFWRERSAERTRCQEADPRSASRPGPGDSGGDGGDTGRDRGDSGGDNGERERGEADAGAAQRTSGSRGRSESSAAQRPPARRELDENDDRTGEDERKDKTAPGEDTLLGLCASPSAAAGREARGSQAPTNAWEEAESVDRVQVTGSPRVVRWTPEIAERVSRSLMREWESLQSACRARLEEAQRQFVACAQSYDAIAEALLSLDPALLQDDKALQDEVKLLVGTAAAQRRDLGLWRGRIRSSLLALPSATCSSSASFCSLPLPACLASLSSPTLPGSAQASPPRFSLDSALEADAFLARARLRAPQHYRGGLHVLRRFREQAEKRNRALESRVSTVQALFDAKASKRDGHSPPHAPAERRAEAELSFESFRRGLSRGEGAATPRETTQSETHEALHMPVKGEKEPSRPAAPASREGGNQGTSTRALEACRDRREAAAAPKEEKGAQRRHATEPTRGPAAEGADAGEGRGRSGRETAVLSGASPAGADSPTDICAIPRLNKHPSSIQIDLLLRRMGAGRRQDPHAGSCRVWGCPRADLTASPLFALERRGGDSSGREPAPRAEPEPDAAMRVAEWRAALERFLVFPPEDQDAAALSALLPPPPCASPLPRASSLRASPCPSASSASCVAAAAPRPRAPWTPRAALLRAFGGPAGGGGTTRPRGAGELAIRSPSEDGDTAQTSRSQRGARGKVAGEGEAREASQSLGTVNDEEKAKLARQLLVATGERSLHLLKPRFELVENSAESGGESDGEASRGDRRGDAAVAQARKALEGGDRAHRGAQGAAWSPSSSRQWRVELERVAFVQDVYPARNAGSDSPRLCLLRAIDAVGLFVCGFQFGQPVVVYAVEKASPDKFFLRVVAMLAATDNALKRRPEELSDLAAEDRLLFATHKFKEDTYTASRVSGLALWHRVLKEGEAADDGAAEREGNRGTCVRARVYILTYSLTLLCYEFTYANGGCRASSPSVSSALPKEHWNEEALELPPGPEGACSTEWTRKNESAGVAGLESCQSACLYPGAGVARGGGGTSSYCFHDDFEVILEEERDFLL
ncbi:hypothetical protein BESB_034870 [Besnoitia besnoiti]|uniref:Uncharacterized protein n=1 Tax=Besnoitia besnoiti TaxID=94643 RepID=A0A2A9MGI6_BESBE|nr:hypothetical protein BESB_034870 [Besnoitia besnoiti]PFH37029.1 hypothetical protein BESB_034870 [Besnoitia besnoiti]